MSVWACRAACCAASFTPGRRVRDVSGPPGRAASRAAAVCSRRWRVAASTSAIFCCTACSVSGSSSAARNSSADHARWWDPRGRAPLRAGAGRQPYRPRMTVMGGAGIADDDVLAFLVERVPETRPLVAEKYGLGQGEAPPTADTGPDLYENLLDLLTRPVLLPALEHAEPDSDLLQRCFGFVEDIYDGAGGIGAAPSISRCWSASWMRGRIWRAPSPTCAGRSGSGCRGCSSTTASRATSAACLRCDPAPAGHPFGRGRSCAEPDGRGHGGCGVPGTPPSSAAPAGPRCGLLPGGMCGGRVGGNDRRGWCGPLGAATRGAARRRGWSCRCRGR